MFVGIQILGILFGLFMLYITYLYYKRGDYGFRDFMIWTGTWISFLFGISFPEFLEGLLEPLTVSSIMDLFTIASFMLLVALMFFVYDKTRKNEKNLNKLVREIALKEKQ